jgi:outer membrane protein assembly factor BamB
LKAATRISLMLLGALMVSSLWAISGPLPLGWRWTGKVEAAPTARIAVSGDKVIVPVGRRVYALDTRTGTEVYSFPSGGDADGEFRTDVVVVGNKVVAANSNKFVYAFNRDDGLKLWTFHLGTATARAVVANETTVFIITSDDRIVALNADTGAKAWSTDYQIDGSQTGSAVLADGQVVFYTSDGRVHAVDAVTQRKSWEVRLLSVPFNPQPVALGSAVLLVSGDQVALVAARSGRTTWVVRLPERIVGGVAVTTRGGIAVTERGNVYAFSLDGRQYSRTPLELGGFVQVPPQPAGENAIVQMTNGAFYLVDPTDMKPSVLWEYTTLPIPGTMRRVRTGDSGGGGGNLGGGGGLGGSGRGGGGGNLGGGSSEREIPADYVAVMSPIVASGERLYAFAEDGSVFAFGRDIGIDETGPSIEMMSPPSGSEMNGFGAVDFIFRIEDQGSGLMKRSISVTFNDQVMKFEYVPAGGYVYVRIRPPGSTQEGANPPLSDGYRAIVVSAADWMGNVSEKRFSVLIDNTLPVTQERVVDSRTGGAGLGGTGGGR